MSYCEHQLSYSYYQLRSFLPKNRLHCLLFFFTILGRKMYSNEEMTPLKDSHLKLKDATVKIHVTPIT